MHITIVTDKLLVTAKAEQIPKICKVIGFSSINGFALSAVKTKQSSDKSASLHSISKYLHILFYRTLRKVYIS